MPSIGQTIKVLNQAVKVGMEAASAVPTEPGEYYIASRQIVCPHCQGTIFQEQFSGAGVLLKTFSQFGILACSRCGRIEMFTHRPKRMPPVSIEPVEVQEQPPLSQDNVE